MFFDKLLAEPSVRLGKNGVDEITKHKFFHGIDWGKLHISKPVFVPNLESVLDCSYFGEVSVYSGRLVFSFFSQAGKNCGYKIGQCRQKYASFTRRGMAIWLGLEFQSVDRKASKLEHCSDRITN